MSLLFFRNEAFSFDVLIRIFSLHIETFFVVVCACQHTRSPFSHTVDRIGKDCLLVFSSFDENDDDDDADDYDYYYSSSRSSLPFQLTGR